MSARTAQQLLEARQAASERIHERYRQFCQDEGVSPSPAAVCLFLTSLADEGLSGPQVRVRLYWLDVAAAGSGKPLPSKEPEVKAFLRGLHRVLPMRPSVRVVDPMRPEDLMAILDVIGYEDRRRHRDVAALLMANLTGSSASALLRMKWSDLHIRHETVTVSLTRRSSLGETRFTRTLRRSVDEEARAMNALIHWRQVSLPGSVGVWNRSWRPWSEQVDEVRAVVRHIGLLDRASQAVFRGEDLDRVVAEVDRPSLICARDRALLLLWYSGCLRWTDLRDLRIRDIELERRGLLLRFPRRRLVGVPHGREEGRCPVAAWEVWREQLDEHGRAREDDPAFPVIYKKRIETYGVTHVAIHKLLTRRTAQAGLDGNFAPGSLHRGALQAASRGGATDLDMSLHARWLSYDTVAAHGAKGRRETLQLARQVGL